MMNKRLFFFLMAGLLMISSSLEAAGKKSPTEVISSYSSPEGDYEQLKTTDDTVLATDADTKVGVGMPASEADAKLAVAGDLTTTANTTVESGVEVKKDLTVSGLLDAQGGLVIQKLPQDPTGLTAQDDGRMWLVSSGGES